MVYCVGLTGNIASGKTTVAEIFSSLGVDVVSADKISRDVTINNQLVYNNIVEHFGTDIILEDRQLNRKRLRDIIFSNPEERKWLEALLHPLIREKIIEQVTLSTTPYCVVEIPLLIDKIVYPYLNKILLINTSQENQITRVMARDHCSREQALAVISAQPKLNVRIQNADYVLTNDCGYSELKHAVENLHQTFILLARLTK